MRENLDDFDKRILTLLQQDASLSTDQLAEAVGLSRNACWRRVRLLEANGVIRGKVVLADPAKLGCTLTALVMIRTSAHNADWITAFQAVLRDMPEVTGAYRMTGDLDYVLRVRVADVPAYDAFYKRLTQRISISDVSASFVMEEIKDTTALPL